MDKPIDAIEKESRPSEPGGSVFRALAIAIALSLLLTGLLVVRSRNSFRKPLDPRGPDGRSFVLDEPR